MLTTVLIGPAAAGKSTVGAILARITNSEFVEVDEVAERYYSVVGQPRGLFARRVAADGFAHAHRWWQPARARALDVVSDHRGAVIALGAGHSHFEDEAFRETARAALRDTRVVLLLPSASQESSLRTLRSRSRESKGHDWIRDGHDYLSEWIASEQNRELADEVVYTDQRSPQDVADGLARKSR